MQVFWTLVRRELGAQFNSWVGYVVIASVIFLLGLSFVSLMTALNSEATDRPLTEMFYFTWYFWLILLVAAPLITMRSFAMEKSTGTFETLMTAPVADLHVVLAKFTGALVFYLLMWLPLLFCLLIVRAYGQEATLLDAGSIGATFLGIGLLGAMYMAIGCFASALTRSQIIASIVSFALGVSLFLLSFLAMAFSDLTGWRGMVLTHLRLTEHMQDFARGVIDTRPVVYYLSLTVLFLYLALKAVESRRWK